MSIKVAYFGSGLAGKTTFKYIKRCRDILIVKICTSDSFSNWQEVNEFLKEQAIDAVIVCSFGKMIPKESLTIPKYKWWNIHYSLLPKYRGSVPIQAALLAGDNKVGVTVFEMVEALDAGKILAQEAIKVEEDDDAKSLILRASETAAQIICRDLPKYIERGVGLKMQKGKPTYCYSLLTVRNNRKINWKNSCNEALSKIKAFVVNGGAWTTFNNKEVKILKAKKGEISMEAPSGTVIRRKSHIYVKCSNGWLEIIKVLVSGKGKMTGQDFGNGYVKGTAIFD